jgi:hypothetical protein
MIIDAAPGAFELARAREAGQHNFGDAEGGDVARVEQPAPACKFEHHLLVGVWRHLLHRAGSVCHFITKVF